MTDYKALIEQLAKSLMPGGDIEKTYMTDVESEGKMLGSQLNAANISRGLGNVTSNVPVTVAKHVAKRKGDIRSSLMQNLLGTFQFLTGLQTQEKEAAENRAFQERTISENRAFQKQMINQQARAQLAVSSVDRDRYRERGHSIGPSTPKTAGFSSQQYPSLASAGGMGGGGYYDLEPPSLFGDR